MRIWSLHPRYLDSKGLVACWRETLLAQKVLNGGTRGYLNHPQLDRFRAGEDPLALIGAYLEGVALEADIRSYQFNRLLILRPPVPGVQRVPLLDVTSGQLEYEREHLVAKLAIRAPEFLAALSNPAGRPQPHPSFTPVPGPIESWEIV